MDDTVYPVAAGIDAEFDSRVTRLSAGYLFHRTPTLEAGVAAGLHVTDFKIGVQGLGRVEGGRTAMMRREEQATTVPLPVVGLFGTAALSERWLGAARFDVFSLSSRSYEGRLMNVQAHLIFRATPRIGLGLGYRYNDYRLNADRSSFKGGFEYEFAGPQLFAEAGF